MVTAAVTSPNKTRFGIVVVSIVFVLEPEGTALNISWPGL